MTIDLSIRIDTAVPEAIDQALKLAASTLLTECGVSSAELSLLLTGDEQLQALNRDFRQVDKTTDVLSFPAGDDPVGLSPDAPYLGDIAISVPYAQRQADAGGHSTTAELQLLAIHGILHLLGYDHTEPEDKSVMWTMQRNSLDLLGLKEVEPSEDA